MTISIVWIKIYLLIRLALKLLGLLYAFLNLNKKQTLKFLKEYWEWELVKSGHAFFAAIFLIILILYRKYILTYSYLDLSGIFEKLVAFIVILILIILLLHELGEFGKTAEKIEEINKNLEKWSIAKSSVSFAREVAKRNPIPNLAIRIALFIGSFIIEAFIDIVSYSKLEKAIKEKLDEIIFIGTLEFIAFIGLTYLVTN